MGRKNEVIIFLKSDTGCERCFFWNTIAVGRDLKLGMGSSCWILDMFVYYEKKTGFQGGNGGIKKKTFKQLYLVLKNKDSKKKEKYTLAELKPGLDGEEFNFNYYGNDWKILYIDNDKIAAVDIIRELKKKERIKNKKKLISTK